MLAKKIANFYATVILRLRKLIAGNPFLRHTRHLTTNSELQDARGLIHGVIAGRRTLIRVTKTSKRVKLNRLKSVRLNNVGNLQVAAAAGNERSP